MGKMAKKIGILTAGSDCPGLNAAIRAIGKAAQGTYGMEIVGFQDGFHGLIEDCTLQIGGSALSGILTTGGTILGTSSENTSESIPADDRSEAFEKARKNYKKHRLDALVCIGGGGTQAFARSLSQAGLNIVTLPKSVDNNVGLTEATIGFSTALEIATQSIDRLHSTAYSHHRIIIVEVMGRYTGWLTLGSGIAGGADVILIPEIPYNIQNIAEAVMRRNKAGKSFSIIAVAEGITSQEEVAFEQRLRQMIERGRDPAQQAEISARLEKIQSQRTDTTFQVSNQLKTLTGLETRITILGYVLRGGAPSAADRVLATRLGTACVSAIDQGQFGVMIGTRGEQVQAFTLDKITNKHKLVPDDHPWVESARRVGTCLGD
jgi:6-phosphofructokinase